MSVGVQDDCFFFFKQKTAYEMRISDWSSDVCSSDLAISKFMISGKLCEFRSHGFKVRAVSPGVLMIASNDGASGLGEIPVSIAWQAEQCSWANASPCRWAVILARSFPFAGLACPVAIAPLTTATAIRTADIRFRRIASSSSGCHGRRPRRSEEHTSEL